MHFVYKITLVSSFILAFWVNALFAQGLEMNCGETGYWAYIAKGSGTAYGKNLSNTYMEAVGECSESLIGSQVSQSGFSCKNSDCTSGCNLSGVDTGGEQITFNPDHAGAACKAGYSSPMQVGTVLIPSTPTYHCKVECEKISDMTLSCGVCFIGPKTTSDSDHTTWND